jgi:hypothetical protein
LDALERFVKQDSKTSRDERNKSLKSDEPSLPAQARQHAPAAIAELVRIIENTRSDAARLAAISILFDRGLGKPPKPLDIAIKDRVKPAPPPSKEELERMVADFDRQMRRITTAHRSMDGLDDAALDLFPGSTPGTPKAEGER